jgi:hypothetical protein
MGVEYRSSVGEIFPCYSCHLDPILGFKVAVGDSLSSLFLCIGSKLLGLLALVFYRESGLQC